MTTVASDEGLPLAVGDGGAATLRFVRAEILPRFANDSLGPLEDGAFAEGWAGRMVVTTDSYVVDPPVFPGGDIGRLAISGTVNDLVASGAEPRYMTLGLVLAEGLSLATLRRVLESAASTARSIGVKVVAGDTKVVAGTTGLGICLNTTGVGAPLWPERDYALSRSRLGDRIIVTGAMGDHALAVLSAREGLGFERRVFSDCAPLWDLLAPVLRTEPGVRALRDPTRGGLKGVLVDLAEAAGLDTIVVAETIPVHAEVRFGCEMLGLDPLDLVNEGKMVMVVDPTAVQSVLTKLRSHALGLEAAAIGVLSSPSGSQPQALLEEGGRRTVLIRPEGQALPRLC